MGFRRIGGKLVKVEDQPHVMVKDGHRMAVLRPLTPEIAQQAIAKAKELSTQKNSSQSAFNAIVSDQEQMIFAGLASTKGRLLDPLEDIGPMEPGDSFIAEKDLASFQKVPQN